MKKSKRIQKPPEPVKLEFQYADREKLLRFPWPYKDNSVAEFLCIDIFPYVPRGQRIGFIDEVYRVLQPGAKATFHLAYYSTMLACCDIDAEWPPLNEMSFMYFQKAWREANQVKHPIKSDFDFNFNYTVPPEVAGRTPDVQAYHIRSYLNTVVRLQVTLTKREVNF